VLLGRSLTSAKLFTTARLKAGLLRDLFRAEKLEG